MVRRSSCTKEFIGTRVIIILKSNFILGKNESFELKIKMQNTDIQIIRCNCS